MSENVWKEYCKSCGCPLETSCKLKTLVISVEEIERWCKDEKNKIDSILNNTLYDKSLYNELKSNKVVLDDLLFFVHNDAEKI